MSKPRIAFLGLGIMGSGMARRLLAHGFPLNVFNRSGDKAAPLAAAGARAASTPREAASGADVIMSMVADDIASRAIWLGENGALAGAKPGAVCLESSTVTVGWVRELAAAALARGCEFLDTPVTGSKNQAAAGELNILAGGSAATLEKVRPVLAALSKSIRLIGPVGSGAVLKLVNNFMCAAQIVSLAQGLAMIERAGLDRARALEVLLNGAPGSPMVKTVAERMVAQDYTPNFPLRLAAKDARYAMAEAAKLSLDLTMAAAALKAFEIAAASGHGDQDMAAVVEPLRQTAV
jgi:3-hydroxyisobutyrate dehydrogenase